MTPTRLDLFILRTTAQRACIDWVAQQSAGLPGIVLEVGLGNGRTYDHLRARFGQRTIHVFDREVAAHPDCIPPAAQMHLGDFRVSVPAFAAGREHCACFVHADVGSANRAASLRLAMDLAEAWVRMLVPGGYLACDQPIEHPALERQPIPGGDYGGCYHLFRQRA